MTLYSIRDWKKNFENHDTRKTVKALTWLPIQIKKGRKYWRLMRLPDGQALFGAFMQILETAAQCPTRGVLADKDGIPLTAQDIIDECGGAVVITQRALDVLSDAQLGIGWIVATENKENPPLSPATPGDAAPIDSIDITDSIDRQTEQTEISNEPSFSEGFRQLLFAAFGTTTPYELSEAVKEYSEETVSKAINKGQVTTGKTLVRWPYIQAIINDWAVNGVPQVKTQKGDALSFKERRKREQLAQVMGEEI